MMTMISSAAFFAFFHTCALLLLLLIIHASPVDSNPRNRTLKNAGLGSLWDLNEMAECKLHYSALAYNDYGCWCGIGGSGTPADAIDACCMAHDKCYDAAVDSGFCYDTELEYIDPYDWSCQAHTEPICLTTLVGCKAALCICDKMVVDCWSKFPKPASKLKCPHAVEGVRGIWEKLVGAVCAIGSFLASIPNSIASFFQ